MAHAVVGLRATPLREEASRGDIMSRIPLVSTRQKFCCAAIAALFLVEAPSVLFEDPLHMRDTTYMHVVHRQITSHGP
jgi:hypothetical protein